MAENVKVVAGSPFTATGDATTRPADITTARLIANGGPCQVQLLDYDAAGNAIDMCLLDADVGNPDSYVEAANRKLHFRTKVGVRFAAGAGYLYLYET